MGTPYDDCKNPEKKKTVMTMIMIELGTCVNLI